MTAQPIPFSGLGRAGPMGQAYFDTSTKGRGERVEQGQGQRKMGGRRRWGCAQRADEKKRAVGVVTKGKGKKRGAGVQWRKRKKGGTSEKNKEEGDGCKIGRAHV